MEKPYFWIQRNILWTQRNRLWDLEKHTLDLEEHTFGIVETYFWTWRNILKTWRNILLELDKHTFGLGETYFRLGGTYFWIWRNILLENINENNFKRTFVIFSKFFYLFGMFSSKNLFIFLFICKTKPTPRDKARKRLTLTKQRRHTELPKQFSEHKDSYILVKFTKSKGKYLINDKFVGSLSVNLKNLLLESKHFYSFIGCTYWLVLVNINLKFIHQSKLLLYIYVHQSKLILYIYTSPSCYSIYTLVQAASLHYKHQSELLL